MARSAGVRLPFGPLEQVVTARFGARRVGPSDNGWKNADLAAVFDVKVKTVEAWRRRGLSVDAADRLAAMAGFHPGEVWGEWWSLVPVVVPDPDPEVLRREKLRAYQREWKRRKRASDPSYVERQREYRRRYYVECGEYERARERAKYWASKAAS